MNNRQRQCGACARFGIADEFGEGLCFRLMRLQHQADEACRRWTRPRKKKQKNEKKRMKGNDFFGDLLSGVKGVAKGWSVGAQRKRPDDEEHRLQESCVTWFGIQYPEMKGLLFAVPNGGRRDARTGARLKAEGVVAGVSDLVLLRRTANSGALLIELKTKDGHQSEHQKEWQKAVGTAGYRYEVVRTLEQFVYVVSDYIRKSRAYMQAINSTDVKATDAKAAQ